MKVLVVDDQPDVVRGILDGVNWSRLKIESAFGANSAAEAREILKREQIDILLCDIEMPGESGLPTPISPTRRAPSSWRPPITCSSPQATPP